MLGLLPGAGGTQRVQKIASIPTVLDLALTGKTIKADRAKKMGLVDLLVDPLGPGLNSATANTIEYLEKVAIATAKDLASGKLKVNRQKTGLTAKATQYIMGFDFVKDQIFKKARQQVMKMTNGLYPAPLRILDVVRVGADKGFEAGLEAERNAFGELSQTAESKGLIGLFRGQTECKKNRFGAPARPTKNVSFSLVNLIRHMKRFLYQIGVLGAGLMGAGIIQVSIDKGYQCVLKDAGEVGLARGITQVQKGLEGGIRRKKITALDRDKILTNLKPTLNYNDFRNCDVRIDNNVDDFRRFKN